MQQAWVGGSPFFASPEQKFGSLAKTNKQKNRAKKG
jgi:hypothetical protein